MRYFPIFAVALSLAGLGCVEDGAFGRELSDFCDLVREAEQVHTQDRIARSAYVAERSDAVVSSKRLMELLRRLAVVENKERAEILVEAGEKGGLRDFQCPAILGLYR